MHKRNNHKELPYCVSAILKSCKMKMNEKNVAAFANSDSAIDKQGFLMKRGGEYNKSFQKRWFVLKGNLLFYFEKRPAGSFGDPTPPVGVVVLEGCTVELADEEPDPYTFQLVFHGAASRTYILAADNQDSMEAWMKAIACAGYDYMKMMVAELQRQVDELPVAPPRPPPPHQQSLHPSQQPDNISTASSGSYGSARSTLSSNPDPMQAEAGAMSGNAEVCGGAGSSSGGRFNPFDRLCPTPGLDAATTTATADGTLSGAHKHLSTSLPVMTAAARTFVTLHERYGSLIRTKLQPATADTAIPPGTSPVLPSPLLPTS